MAVSDRAAVVGTYAQQLLDNQDVQTSARQAVDATARRIGAPVGSTPARRFRIASCAAA
jgi:hypothetical protein